MAEMSGVNLQKDSVEMVGLVSQDSVLSTKSSLSETSGGCTHSNNNARITARSTRFAKLHRMKLRAVKPIHSTAVAETELGNCAGVQLSKFICVVNNENFLCVEFFLRISGYETLFQLEIDQGIDWKL